MIEAAAPPEDWSVIALAPSLEVQVTSAMPELAPSLEAAIGRHWERVQGERARAGRRSLFNGTVFSADAITPDRITGHWTEYRRVLAQMQDGTLFDALRIRSLAVTGLLQCADGLVLGRRESGSIYQAGIWQSPPAGSVERRSSFPAGSGGEESVETIDLAGQLLAECEEELGLPADAVQVMQPVATIEHPGTHIVDVAFQLQTGLEFAAVQARWRAEGNREYDQLRRLDLAVARAEGTPPDLALLPTTRLLFTHWLHRANFA